MVYIFSNSNESSSAASGPPTFRSGPIGLHCHFRRHDSIFFLLFYFCNAPPQASGQSLEHIERKNEIKLLRRNKMKIMRLISPLRKVGAALKDGAAGRCGTGGSGATLAAPTRYYADSLRIGVTLSLASAPVQNSAHASMTARRLSK